MEEEALFAVFKGLIVLEVKYWKIEVQNFYPNTTSSIFIEFLY